jgi:hypothetical protein
MKRAIDILLRRPERRSGILVEDVTARERVKRAKWRRGREKSESFSRNVLGDHLISTPIQALDHVGSLE